MVQRKGGSRAGSRNILRKHYRNKGKISLSRYFETYNKGDRAILKAEPAVQKSIYHVRFHGLQGIITGQRGNSYEVKIKDGGKEKKIYIHPVHLKKTQ